jgi:hypothetical protein
VIRLFGLLSLLQLLPASAAEAPLPGRPLLERLVREARDLQVGQWVTYELDGGAGRASFWRIAVVGQERDKRGRDALWIEIEIGTHPELVAPMAQLRVLVARELGMTSEGISRLVVGQGFEKPMEVAPEAIPAFVAKELPPLAGGATQGSMSLRVGSPGSLLTHAGTLRATPVELWDRHVLVQRLWMSPRVPVLHVAKIELPAVEHAMTVHAFGSDAAPRIPLPASEDPKIHLDRYNAAPAGGAR